jgi:hypothetical protein
MLFGALPEEAFRIFNSKYRHAYEGILRRLNERVFSVELFDEATKEEVLATISDVIDVHRRSIAPERAGEFRLDAAGAYDELRATGWFQERRSGWDVFVEMPQALARMLDLLCDLAASEDDAFGDTLVSVLSNLEAAVNNPDERVRALFEASKRAREFARYLRSVAGTLKTIEVELIEQASMNGFVAVFFDSFVKRILIRDYANLTSLRRHPFRLASQIDDILLVLETDGPALQGVQQGLVDDGRCPDMTAAAAMVNKEVEDLRRTLEAIEDFRRRIDLARTGIERRFENAVRYMDVLRRDGSVSYADALSRLGRAFPKGSDGEEPVEVPTHLMTPPPVLGAAGMTRPPQARRIIDTVVHAAAPVDPLRLAFDRARAEFAEWLTITPKKFLAFVERQLEEADEIDASAIAISDLQQAVIFAELRALPRERIALPNAVDLIRTEGEIENEWLRCGGFRLRRSRRGGISDAA